MLSWGIARQEGRPSISWIIPIIAAAISARLAWDTLSVAIWLADPAVWQGSVTALQAFCNVLGGILTLAAYGLLLDATRPTVPLAWVRPDCARSCQERGPN